MLTAGSIGMAAVTLVLALAQVAAVDAVALVVGGACWILALSTLNSVYQLSLPRWIKARGMSYYLVVFQGGGAIGSAVMGITAGYAGLRVTLAIAAAGLALGPLAALAWRFQAIPPEELLPAGDWPAPHLAAGTESAEGTGSAGTGSVSAEPAGPVLVTVDYVARAGQAGELMAALEETRFSRRRTGAISWRAWQDASDENRILEQFVVASWAEHLRQHERVTKRDQDRLDKVRALADPDQPVTVTHWLAPHP
jgi:MFS family permease